MFNDERWTLNDKWWYRNYTLNESPSKIACMKRGRYMHVPNLVHACDGYAACMIQITIHNWQFRSAARAESSFLDCAEPARNLDAEHYNSRFFDEKGVFWGFAPFYRVKKFYFWPGRVQQSESRAKLLGLAKCWAGLGLCRASKPS